MTVAICLGLLENKADKEAFEILYNKNNQKAYRIAYSILKNEAMSEDAVSEAFLNIAKSFEKIHNLNSHKLDRYVVITIRNTALSMLKSEKMYINAEKFEDDEQYFENADFLEYDHLQECIKKLSYTDQEILYLRFSLDLDYKQISAALNISNAASRQRLRYAKHKLKKLLTEDC